MEDDRQLRDCVSMKSLENAEFVGRYTIQIDDVFCDMGDAIDVFDWWSLDHLQVAYTSKRKRVILPGAKWSLVPSSMHDEYVLSLLSGDLSECIA